MKVLASQELAVTSGPEKSYVNLIFTGKSSANSDLNVFSRRRPGQGYFPIFLKTNSGTTFNPG